MKKIKDFINSYRWQNRPVEQDLYKADYVSTYIKTYFKSISSSKKTFFPEDIFQTVIHLMNSKDPDSLTLLKGLIETSCYKFSDAQKSIILGNHDIKHKLYTLLYNDFSLDENNNYMTWSSGGSIDFI